MSNAEVSKLMFEAKESLEMWNDVVNAKMGRDDPYTKGLIDRIVEYRKTQGWSPNGFGGEDE